MGWLFRNPRTQQERRINGSREYRRVEIEVGGEVQEFRIRIRGKRSTRMLVSAWDDLPPGRQRSWKRHRRTQYRARETRTVERSPSPGSDGRISDSQAARTTNRLPLLLDGERRVDVDDGRLEVGGCLGMVGAGLRDTPAGSAGLDPLGVRVRLAFVDRRLGGDNRGSRSHAVRTFL